MPVSPEFQRAAQKRHAKVARAAGHTAAESARVAAERAKQVRKYNDAIDAATEIGPAVSQKVARAAAHRQAAGLPVDNKDRPDTTLLVRTASGRGEIHGWRILSASGRYEGSGSMGDMGVILTESGRLVGYRTDTYATQAGNIPTARDKEMADRNLKQHVILQADGCFAIQLQPGESGLQQQEQTGGLGDIRDRAVYGSLNPGELHKRLVEFAVDRQVI